MARDLLKCGVKWNSGDPTKELELTMKTAVFAFLVLLAGLSGAETRVEKLAPDIWRARVESDEPAFYSPVPSFHPKVRCAWTQPHEAH